MIFSRTNPPARKPAFLYPPTSNMPLNIIVEEDESRSSSPVDANPVLDIKTRRRHATVSVSDIDRLSRVLPADDFSVEEDDEEKEDDSFPSSTSSQPTTYSPLTSPDCFSLKFAEESFGFPLPPLPTPTSLESYLRHAGLYSPTHSSSSLSSTSQTEALTPSASDDESSPSIMPQWPTIQPLLITKHNQRHFSGFDDDSVISPPLFRPFKTQPSTDASPLSPQYSPEVDEYNWDETSDSEYESDSEWYSREFSKIISLPSPLTPSFPFAPHSPPARPDSMSTISLPERAPRSSRRVSKPLPPIPSFGGVPSGQLDPAFPRRRRRSLPKYPPPPIPTIRIEPGPSPLTSPLNLSRRPPPRSSIPADCVYDITVDDSASSTFSFSIYDVYLGGEPDDGSDSAPSSYSQSSFRDPIDEVTFDLEYPMMLPLSLPNTPLDLEGDIAQGLEELRNTSVEVTPPAAATDAVVAVTSEKKEKERKVKPNMVVELPQQSQTQDDGWSFTPSSPSCSFPNEERLKSRWSASTLASIREDHERRGSAGNWRLYFAGHSPIKRKISGSKKTTNGSPPAFISSFPVLAPLRHKSFTALPTSSPPTRSRSSSKAVQSSHARSQSDMFVNGGVRRRGSLTNSVSDAGSEDSWSSTSSSGLRRKPIPVEMFLRV